MKKKCFLPLGILAVLVLAALIYTRPMPLEALCEADITQCKAVFGTHFRAPQAEDTRFEFPSNDARCAQLTALFAQQKFRRWEVGFCFDETDFPDGSTGKGMFVQCRNFFGKMQLFRAYDGKSFRCTVQDQDAFLPQVYGIISSEP